MTGRDEMPRYSGASGGLSPGRQPDANDVGHGAGGDGPDLMLRTLSVAPFVVLAALGLIAGITWIVIIIFGAGSSEPVWRWVEDQPAGHVAEQVLIAVLLGVIPVAVTAGASWAVVHGFRERTKRWFWPLTELVWSALAVALVVIDRARPEWLDDLGVSTIDWWFAFGVVAFAMVTAWLRMKRRRGSR